MANKTAKQLTAAAIAIMASATATASETALSIHDINVDVDREARTLSVALTVDMKDYRLKSNRELVMTPVVMSADGRDSVVMEPFAICGRNSWYWHLRDGSLDAGMPVYRAGKNQTVEMADIVPLQDWMLDGSTVEMRVTQTSCCSRPELMPGNSPWGNTLMARINDSEPAFTDDYVFSPPMESEPVRRSLEGKAFVTFVVNKTDLNPTYMDNPRELAKITGSIDFVKADPDAVIKEVHIRGYASPEGSYANNERLAKGRTQTLAQYVNSLYRFAPGIMTTSYDPEDWTGLRAYVADSMGYNLTDRKGLLAVIDGPLGYDERDAALKRDFPKDYQVLLKEIYPWLRHSDYAVKYEIKVYDDLDNLNRLYNQDPGKLRAVDFYTVAQQYPTGSPEYLAVMKTALKTYPEQPMINLNVANLYMMEGDYEAAGACLLKAGQSPQADYARGVLAAKTGDYTEAEKWFRLAEEGGVSQAAANLKAIETARSKPAVEILLPLSGAH